MMFGAGTKAIAFIHVLAASCRSYYMVALRAPVLGFPPKRFYS